MRNAHTTHEPAPHEAEGSRLGRIAHYAVFALLVVGGLAYWALKPPTINPMSDAKAAEALALVQTHAALGAPTLLQAIGDHVRKLEERGQGVRQQPWTVEKQQGPNPDLYLVKVSVREREAQRWFEREFVWQANLGKKTIAPVSMPAESLMPLGFDKMTRPIAPPAGP